MVVLLIAFIYIYHQDSISCYQFFIIIMFLVIIIIVAKIANISSTIYYFTSPYILLLITQLCFSFILLAVVDAKHSLEEDAH